MKVRYIVIITGTITPIVRTETKSDNSGADEWEGHIGSGCEGEREKIISTARSADLTTRWSFVESWER